MEGSGEVVEWCLYLCVYMYIKILILVLTLSMGI